MSAGSLAQEIHLAHPAFAELLQNLVMAVQSNVGGRHFRDGIYRNRRIVGGIKSAFSVDTRNVVRCEAGRVLETAILVLVSRKGDPVFSATNFSWSHGRLVCPE